VTELGRRLLLGRETSPAAPLSKASEGRLGRRTLGFVIENATDGVLGYGQLYASARQLGPDPMTTEPAPDQTVVRDALGEPAVVENAHLLETRERRVPSVWTDSPYQLLGDLGSGERSSRQHCERERHRG